MLYQRLKMDDHYIADKTFEKANSLLKAEYENCIFKNCDFANQDFSDYKFSDCSFQNCNLSMVKLTNTSFREVQFVECKMLGLHFNTCDEYGVTFSFDACHLNHSSFYNKKLKKTIFRNSNLQECDFSDADLTGTVFDNCNLEGAIFDQTILGKVDFRTAYNYAFDPEKNRIKKAKFSSTGIAGLLAKYDIEIE